MIRSFPCPGILVITFLAGLHSTACKTPRDDSALLAKKGDSPFREVEINGQNTPESLESEISKIPGLSLNVNLRESKEPSDNNLLKNAAEYLINQKVVVLACTDLMRTNDEKCLIAYGNVIGVRGGTIKIKSGGKDVSVGIDYSSTPIYIVQSLKLLDTAKASKSTEGVNLIFLKNDSRDHKDFETLLKKQLRGAVPIDTHEFRTQLKLAPESVIGREFMFNYNHDLEDGPSLAIIRGLVTDVSNKEPLKITLKVHKTDSSTVEVKTKDVTIDFSQLWADGVFFYPTESKDSK